MKLRHLVVASMSVLGLISGPVFAADTTTQTQTTTTTATSTTTAHVKHHKKAHKRRVRHHHHYVAQAQALPPVQAAPVMEVMPKNDPLTGIYDGMTQNSNRAKPMPDWFNRIGLSGGANMDGHWGNRSMGYMGENNRLLSLNDVYVNASATVNDWTRAFASLSYNNASGALTGSLPLAATKARPKAGIYSAAYGDNSTTNDSISLEQAYVTFANFDESPFFFQAGKQFEDFGRYNIHPITRTMTQSMSETLRTSVNAGFITKMGLHGSVYAFNNPMRPGAVAAGAVVATSSNRAEYGAAIGFDQVNDQLGYNVGVGYLSNMVAVNDINYAVGIFNATGMGGSYVRSVGGVAVYGNVNSGPFTLSGHYVSALSRFNPNDLSTQYATVGTFAGAQPWSADLMAGFGFTNFTYGLNTLGKNQNIYLGYQISGNAINLYLPKDRWTVGYNVDMWRHANIGLEYNHDMDYSRGLGGTGRSSNTIAARASVSFG